MKRTTITLLAIALAVGISGTAVAQGQHDDKPHGYDVKVAAAQQASAVTSTYVTLPGGPRAQDNPLRGKRIVVSAQEGARRDAAEVSEDGTRFHPGRDSAA